ncbi:MAG: hypothetical protein LBO75_00785 [Bifidobacteriaceae bacterium]|jgi:hypothetical protein|nr:hypothetical protein [Bifidobacteriaceae bacterium]
MVPFTLWWAPHLIIRYRRFRQQPVTADCFAAPKFVATAAKARTLEEYLGKRLGHFKLLYTRSQKGRALLVRVRQRSFVSKNARELEILEYEIEQHLSVGSSNTG